MACNDSEAIEPRRNAACTETAARLTAEPDYFRYGIEKGAAPKETAWRKILWKTRNPAPRRASGTNPAAHEIELTQRRLTFRPAVFLHETSSPHSPCSSFSFPRIYGELYVGIFNWKTKHVEAITFGRFGSRHILNDRDRLDSFWDNIETLKWISYILFYVSTQECQLKIVN